MKPTPVFFLIFAMSLAGFAHAKDDPTYLTQTRFNESIVYLDAQEERCYADEHVLPENTLDSMTLNTEQKKIVLSYFYFKNLTDCTEEAVKNYLLEAVLLASLVPDQADDIRDSNELIIHTHIAKTKAETKYLSLPPHVRHTLDQISVLQTPFNLGKSARSLISPEEN